MAQGIFFVDVVLKPSARTDTETGAGILNLTVAGETVNQTITGLGAAIGVDQLLGAARLSADLRLTWEHVFGDTSVIARSAIPIASGTFVTSSATPDRDRVAVGAGAALTISERLSAHLRYDGVFANSFHNHSGAAGVTLRF